VYVTTTNEIVFKARTRILVLSQVADFFIAITFNSIRLSTTISIAKILNAVKTMNMLMLGSFNFDDRNP
jgi:hypothetical protein